MNDDQENQKEKTIEGTICLSLTLYSSILAKHFFNSMHGLTQYYHVSCLVSESTRHV